MRAVVRVRAAICLLGALLPAGCGSLPQPFAGHPGALATRLAQPPPARLAVQPPVSAMLPDAAARDYAQALVAALVDRDVPAVAEPARRGDWSLGVTAELSGSKVVPAFSVLDPSGLVKGTVQGAPEDAAQWAAGTAAALQRAASADAPAISALLTHIEADRQLSDPNSLVNRPARILVREVTGAPGDGNRQLTRALRQQLPQLGEIIEDNADAADFAVQGEVATADGEKGTERIEIQWIVIDRQGRELGRVVQLNEVEPHSLDKFWGDVALVVAQEAAGGIRNVVQNQLAGRATAK